MAITLSGIEYADGAQLLTDLQDGAYGEPGLGVLVSSVTVRLPQVAVNTTRAVGGDEERNIRRIVESHHNDRAVAADTSLAALKSDAKAVSIDPAVVMILLTWQQNVKKHIDWCEAEIRRLRGY